MIISLYNPKLQKLGVFKEAGSTWQQHRDMKYNIDMECVVHHIRDINAGDRHAIEHIISQTLRGNQRLISRLSETASNRFFGKPPILRAL